jgi:hypothetical protein
MAAPPPVPSIADSNRYALYQPTSSTQTFAVPFPVFGDGSDIAVYLNGQVATGWTFSSASGLALSTIALPITDGQVTLASAISSGKLEIFGLWRPRQPALNTSSSISRREYQQDLGQVVAYCREAWATILNTFPLSKSSRANSFLGFDANGNPVAASSVTTTTVPVSAAMQPVIAAATYPAALSLMGFATWFQGLIGATSASTFWTAVGGVTTFGQSLMGAANAAAALTTLGVSSFMQTVLPVANAAAALTTLGLTAFGQSLVGAANAAAALTTLGLSSLAQSVVAQSTAGAWKNLLGYAPAKRQTVVAGPVTASGLPAFLPATGAGLAVTSIGIAAATPLVVSAANGGASGGANDLVGIATANLTWSGLTASATNYLYVTVNAAGALTPGSTTLPPIYQQGGTPSSVNNQFTFNIGQMQGFLGNGTSSAQAFAVFVGEAVTSPTAVTSTVAYAYNGVAITAPIAVPAVSTQTSLAHNLGVGPVGYEALVRLVCATADHGYAVGAEIDFNLVGQTGGTIAAIDAHNVSLSTEATISFSAAPYAGGAATALTTASWNVRLYARRIF